MFRRYHGIRLAISNSYAIVSTNDQKLGAKAPSFSLLNRGQRERLENIRVIRRSPDGVAYESRISGQVPGTHPPSGCPTGRPVGWPIIWQLARGAQPQVVSVSILLEGDGGGGGGGGVGVGGGDDVGHTIQGR